MSLLLKGLLFLSFEHFYFLIVVTWVTGHVLTSAYWWHHAGVLNSATCISSLLTLSKLWDSVWQEVKARVWLLHVLPVCLSEKGEDHSAGDLARTCEKPQAPLSRPPLPEVSSSKRMICSPGSTGLAKPHPLTRTGESSQQPGGPDGGQWEEVQGCSWSPWPLTLFWPGSHCLKCSSWMGGRRKWPPNPSPPPPGLAIKGRIGSTGILQETCFTGLHRQSTIKD